MQGSVGYGFDIYIYIIKICSTTYTPLYSVKDQLIDNDCIKYKQYQIQS